MDVKELIEDSLSRIIRISIENEIPTKVVLEEIQDFQIWVQERGYVTAMEFLKILTNSFGKNFQKA